MKIEEGKFYKTRRGKKVGPATRENQVVFGKEFHWRVGTYTYTHSGEVGYSNDIDDIVSEWSDEGPVRTETVTKKVIVPGAYGRLTVSMYPDWDDVVGLTLRNRLGDNQKGGSFNAAELRDMSATFIAIAEALEEGK